MNATHTDRHFIRSTVTDEAGRDQIDRDLDAMIEVDQVDFNPPSRRKDVELEQTLALLDSLETKGGPQ